MPLKTWWNDDPAQRYWMQITDRDDLEAGPLLSPKLPEMEWGYDLVSQVTIQAKNVLFTLLWSGIVSAILYKFVDLVIGLRPMKQAELEGLDITDHGERAYNP